MPAKPVKMEALMEAGKSVTLKWIAPHLDGLYDHRMSNATLAWAVKDIWK